MKKLLNVVLLSALAAASIAPFAATRTVTLSVPGMTCEVCPITVKKSLTRVDGVGKADVSYETKQAVVTFDDAKTNVDALLKSTANAGYPSTVRK